MFPAALCFVCSSLICFLLMVLLHAACCCAVMCLFDYRTRFFIRSVLLCIVLYYLLFYFWRNAGVLSRVCVMCIHPDIVRPSFGLGQRYPRRQDVVVNNQVLCIGQYPMDNNAARKYVRDRTCVLGWRLQAGVTTGTFF